METQQAETHPTVGSTLFSIAYPQTKDTWKIKEKIIIEWRKLEQARGLRRQVTWSSLCTDEEIEFPWPSWLVSTLRVAGQVSSSVLGHSKKTCLDPSACNDTEKEYNFKFVARTDPTARSQGISCCSCDGLKWTDIFWDLNSGSSLHRPEWSKRRGLLESMREGQLGPYLAVFALLRVKHLSAGDKEPSPERRTAHIPGPGQKHSSSPPWLSCSHGECYHSRSGMGAPAPKRTIHHKKFPSALGTLLALIWLN